MANENPFQDPLRFERQVPECAVVIFGANGDLTKRKLMPALYRLAYDRRLSTGFAVVGSSRTPLTDDQFRENMRAAVKEFSEDTDFDTNVWQTFAQGLFYVAGDVGDPGLYDQLAQKLAAIENQRHTGGNVMFYLSTQPSQYAGISHGLGGAGLGKGTGWRRLVVEKPFGHDLASARELSDRLHEVFNESDVYRIDHYLGKETVQNILAFRFGNGIFEPLWNRRYVNHVQITGAESIGVEDRGGYYEEAGALDDMIQNHLLQVMATIAMEPSASFQARSVRDERSKLLRSIRPMTPDEVRQNTVPGQYGPARIGGKDVPGYRQEKKVNPASQQNTYAAVTFFIDNWRWAGVPFYLRTGKRLTRRTTEIAIQFKQAPFALFRDTPVDILTPNVLALQIQPDEGASLQFGAKIPGPEIALGGVRMNFSYKDYFNTEPTTGYETLVYDCMIGDQMLFNRADGVEAGWEVVQPILDLWQNDKTAPLEIYPAGSAGPEAADNLLWRSGRQWRPIA
jgi:glucose-6-phosphate 1-dehydrogenase